MSTAGAVYVFTDGPVGFIYFCHSSGSTHQPIGFKRNVGHWNGNNRPFTGQALSAAKIKNIGL